MILVHFFIFFRLNCEIGMAYTPGILSQILHRGSSVNSSVKPTKLQALFDKPAEQLLASRKYVVCII
jgi:hypothetical protein